MGLEELKKDRRENYANYYEQAIKTKLEDMDNGKFIFSFDFPKGSAKLVFHEAAFLPYIKLVNYQIANLLSSTLHLYD